jgi:hypothetical protein
MEGGKNGILQLKESGKKGSSQRIAGEETRGRRTKLQEKEKRK